MSSHVKAYWGKLILKIPSVIILMTINMNDLNLDNILLNEKSYENYSIYDIACRA